MSCVYKRTVQYSQAKQEGGTVDFYLLSTTTSTKYITSVYLPNIPLVVWLIPLAVAPASQYMHRELV